MLKLPTFIVCFLLIALPPLPVALGVDSTAGDGAPPPPATTQGAGGDVEATALPSPAAPTLVGQTEPQFWKRLTDAQQAEAVASLKAFGQRAGEQLKHPLHLQESRLFLLYCDLQENEASKDLLLLDRMYARLAELFTLERGRNIWRGKALVFIFSRVEDYRLFERLIEDNDPGPSNGMTHCFGNGMVHMAFYRSPGEAAFAHLLVHECVHGFLHRYRSPSRIPSWVNEGLADALASELIPDPRRAKFVLGLSKAGLEQHHHSVDDLFTARHIDGWQYPIAETLCATMIRENRRGYLDFLNGIKDGQDWEQSLKSNFKLTPDRLLNDYGKNIGEKSIKK